MCLLGTGALIGLSTDLAKVASEQGVEPLAYLTWSVLVSGLVLGAVSIARGRLPTPSKSLLMYSAIAATLTLAVPQLIFVSAVPVVGASFVALSIAFPPLYTYLGALALKTEPFVPRRALGVAIAFGGATLLAVFKLSEPDAPLGWILLTLAAPVLLAAGNLYRTISWPAGARPDELAPPMLLASAAILVACALVPGQSLGVAIDEPAAIGLIAAQAAAFALQYTLFFTLQQRGGPVYLSLLGSVAAVVGSAIAIIFLGEVAPGGLLPAGVLIAIGVALLTISGPKAARPFEFERTPTGSDHRHVGR